MWTPEDRVLVGPSQALSDAQYHVRTLDRRRNSVWLRSLHQLGRAALVVAAITALAVPRSMAWAAVPQGVWLIEGKAAVQIYGCDGLLCGRVVWLQIPRDPQGQLGRDTKNPDPALRQRLLCGLTIIWGVQPAGPDRWQGGWFYNPDDGKTYDLSAELRSADVLIARIGTRTRRETKTLVRVPHGTSEGWC